MNLSRGSLTILVAVSLLALAAALCFMALALFLWVANSYRDRKTERLRAEWQGALFERISARQAEPAPIPVKPGQSKAFIELLLDAARKFQGEAFAVLCALAAPHLPAVYRDCRASALHRRAWAVRVLGTFGLPRYAEAVQNALRDPSPVIRMIAFRSLILHGRTEYLDRLIAGLATLPQWNSNFLASLLSSLGPQVAPRLRDYFAAPRCPEPVKTVLAVALRQLNDQPSSAIAGAVLRSNPGRNLAAACLRLLYSAGLPDQAETVRELCASPDPTVRAQAVRTLGQLGGPEDLNLLASALQDSDPWVSIHAAESLREIGGLESKKTLEAAARSGGLPGLSALQALQEPGR